MKKAGRRLRTEHLDVRVADSLLSHARVAVIVGKHGHTIVERNLLRRRLRELARTKMLPFVRGVDVVLRTQATAYQAPFGKLTTEVEQVAKELSREVHQA